MEAKTESEIKIHLIAQLHYLLIVVMSQHPPIIGLYLYQFQASAAPLCQYKHHRGIVAVVSVVKQTTETTQSLGVTYLQGIIG